MEKLTHVNTITFTNSIRVETYKDVDGNLVTFVYDEQNRLKYKRYDRFYNTIFRYENDRVIEDTQFI